MIDFVLTVTCFAIAVIIHAWTCRQKPQGVLYAKDFMIIAACVLVVQIYYMLHWPGGAPRFILSAIIIYILLIPSFLIVYISMLLLSPSKRILQALSEGCSLTQDQLLARFNGDELIDKRLEELLKSQCIVMRVDRYCLTFQGEIIYHGLSMYQKLCGRRGEG